MRYIRSSCKWINKKGKHVTLVHLATLLLAVAAIAFATTRIPTASDLAYNPKAIVPARQRRYPPANLRLQHENQADFVIGEKVVVNSNDLPITIRMTEESIFESPYGEDHRVLVTDYNEATNKIAYISGISYPEEDESGMKVVYIYDLDTGEHTMVYSLTTQRDPGREYSITIRDVGFSPSGNTLAITTSDSMFLYDTRSGALTPAFHIPKDENQKDTAGVFYYSRPTFSPAEDKILLYEGYYEGVSPIIFDVDTKTLTRTEYRSYGGGTSVVGWYGDLLVANTHDNFLRGFNSRVFLVSPIDLSEQTIAETNGSFYGNIVSGAKVYGQIARHTEVEGSLGIYTSVNLETGEVTEYFTLDSRHSDNRYSRYRDGQSLRYSEPAAINGKEMIVMQIYFNEVPSWYLLDPNEGNVIHPLEIQ